MSIIAHDNLQWFTKHIDKINLFHRGIEREALRVTKEKHLANSMHPIALGSALTNNIFTTDFAENLIELVTPVFSSVDQLMQALTDIHKYTYDNLGQELLWPLSMPCFLEDEDNIRIAEYGSSNLAKFKSLYRKGLKVRYGAMMQTIAGIHYNFSFDQSYWQARFHQQDNLTALISASYFNIIRNYYRYGWLIAYLFGASPGMCSSFIKEKNQDKLSTFNFKTSTHGFLYTDNVTSLRLSDLGYNSQLQASLAVDFNNLSGYVENIKAGLHQSVPIFEKIGLRDSNGEYQQLNTNLLQIINEYYAPIRPKRKKTNYKNDLDALMYDGVEYLEIRSIDVNPFAPTGIDQDQIRILDLFLIWCELTTSAPFKPMEHKNYLKNWQQVILNGRQPELILNYQDQDMPLAEILSQIFTELQQIAQIIDATNGNQQYQQSIAQYTPAITEPSLTLANQVLDHMLQLGLGNFGIQQAKQFKQQFTNNDYSHYSAEYFNQLAVASLQKQKALEQASTLSFDDYLYQQLNQ